MASLSPEQISQVQQWADEGATLDTIQNRLKSEFDLVVTYLDARLLLVDIGVSLKDKPRPKNEEEEPKVPTDPALEDEPVPAAEATSQPVSPEGPAGGEDGAGTESTGVFQMEADALTVPGTLVSGSATFSDGVQAKWFLDQMGRLSLKADQEGYQPPPADVPLFQRELEQILAKKGMF